MMLLPRNRILLTGCVPIFKSATFVADGSVAAYVGSSVRNSSIRSNSAGPPMAVGAMPVRVKSPKSLHKSTVTVVQFSGASDETCMADQLEEFVPEK